MVRAVCLFMFLLIHHIAIRGDSDWMNTNLHANQISTIKVIPYHLKHIVVANKMFVELFIFTKQATHRKLVLYLM